MEKLHSGRRFSKDELITELTIENGNLIGKVKTLEEENKKLKDELFAERSQTVCLRRRLELEEDS